jgi:hypothetical protein
MPRVVPSQVVAFIASIPGYKPKEDMKMSGLGRPALSATLALAEQVPGELLTMDSASYAMFVYAKEQIKEMLDEWSANRTMGVSLREFQLEPSRNPLTRLCDALAKCPDQSPAPSTSELAFIADLDLRANLRNDMGAINRALANGEWKAATVLAGSAIEALLLWDLQTRHASAFPASVAKLVGNLTLKSQPPSTLEAWNLHQYIEVSADIGTITAQTASLARLAKDFRNLIHPGRAQRLGQRYERPEALSAVAGMDAVARDLA